MFNKNTILALALLLVAINAQSLAFDLRGIQYSQGKDFWTVDIPCTGGSGKYAFDFDIPSTWKVEKNRLFIPSASVQQLGNRFAARCKVRDVAKGDILERSLVFRPFQQGSSINLEVSDHDYFYGLVGSSASESGSSIHGLDVLKRLGAIAKSSGSLNLNFPGAGAVNSIKSRSIGFGFGQVSGGSGSSSSSSSSSSPMSSSSASSSMSSSSSASSVSGSVSGSSSLSGVSIFNSLPTIQTLEKYIAAGAIVEIIQTIQLVVDSKIRCEAKTAYLSDFLGRIQAVIEVKKFTLNELKAIVTQAIAQVQKLTAQITQIKSQQAALNLTELKKQLDLLVVQLKAAYEEYNKFSSSYTSYETEIATLEKEINEINIRYTEVQRNLQQWRKDGQEIDAEIAQYELKIKKLREKRSGFTQDIAKAETFIGESDVRIKQIREQITLIKTKITTASTQRETLKKAYLELEIKVNSVKSAFESANAKFMKYEQEITSITVEIERYQKQTSELEGKQVTQQIENLQSAITEIKASIDFVRYKCFNAGDIEIDIDSKGKGCYHFGQNQWFGYVNNFYTGLSDQIRNRIAQAFNKQIVEISAVGVFSDLWKQNYGSIFEKEIASKGQNWRSENSFRFDSDFSCSSEIGRLESRSGVIEDIRSNEVRVRGDDGREYTLRLGSCSRFEGAGKNFLPRKGHNVLFNGAQNGGLFNMHSCTCF